MARKLKKDEKLPSKHQEEKPKATIYQQMDKVEQDHPVTKTHHLEMLYQYAMYLGHQYLLPNYEDNELIETIVDREARCCYNFSAGFCDTFDAKMLKDRPIPQAYPSGFEPEDISSARFASAAIEQWWGRNDISDLLFEAVGWASKCGTGVIKQYWDGPSRKDKQGEDEEDKKEDGKELKTKVGKYLISGDKPRDDRGDCKVEVIAPWNFFPDHRGTTIKNCRHAFHVYPMPIVEIQRIYGDKADGVKAESIEDYRSLLSSYTEGAVDSEDSYTGVFAEEVTLVREYWERGVPGHDAGFGVGKGRFIVRAGGVTLYEGPNPYGKRLPFILFTVGKPSDSIWGRGIMEKIAGMQHDYNRINSLTMENIDWTAICKFVVPRGTNIEDNAINKLSGEVIEFDAESGQAPHQMQIASMPAYVSQFKQEILQSAMDVVGLHEVSFAQLPKRGSEISGRALNTLVEAESARFAREIMCSASSIKEMAIFFMELLKENFTDDQLREVLGKNRETEMEDFMKSSLRGNTDIFVEVGSGFGLSPSNRIDQLMMLYDRKAIDAPTLLRLSEFGTSGKLYYDATLDENKAHRHLQHIIKTGNAPNISRYDNHQAIIKIFKDFIRSPEYDKLDEDIQDAIEAYVDEHFRKEIELAEHMKQIATEAQSQGQPNALTTGGAPGAAPFMTPDQTQMAMEEQMAMSPGAPPSQDMGGMMPQQG